MGNYAKDTSVSTELSRLEIEKTLIRYGATGFAYATEPGRAMIGFCLHYRHVRVRVAQQSIEAVLCA